jgi:glycosyltransferase involved in cell wall biosynthesis
VRILVVHETCGWFGGVEQNVVVTADALRARGHQVSLLYERRSDRDPERYAARFERAVEAPPLDTPAGDEAWRALLREERPDVIYLHKLARLPASFERAPCPVVRMVHDHDLCCPRRHRYLAWSQRICRWPAGWRCWLDAAFVAREAGGALGWVDLGAHARELARNHGLDRVLVGSRFMREELIRNGLRPDRIHVLPPVLPRERRSPPPPTRDPVVLFVGQLVTGKGVDLLLDALAQVPPPWRAEIVGDGNGRSALEARAEALGLGGRVRFTGWVDHEALDSHYAASRVLVVPSRWAEPFGMIGLEAMHRARPVVAFAAGGIPDWCEDGRTGLLVPVGDTDGLAAAIARVLRDDDLARRLGQAGWERVAERYAFDDYVRALERHLTLQEDRP